MDRETIRRNLDDALAKLEHFLIREDLVEMNEALPCTAGGYGDVYRASLRGPDGVSSSAVAVKELRAVGDDIARTRRAIHLARELRIWARLKHPNILELVGYYLNPQMTTARFISPFMTNGNINEYLEAAPGPVSDNTRLKLLRDSLNGLVYLHSLDPPICHADIKPANVLIIDRVEAVLCDFGLARLADGQPSGLTTTKTIKGSIRYMSPELVEENAVHTLSSDVWAFGCLGLEVMTSSAPYATASSDIQILTALIKKQPPADLSDPKFQDHILKPLLRKCWDWNPSARPSACECLLYLPEPGKSELLLPKMKYDSSSSVGAHSSGRHARDISPPRVWKSESAAGVQAEPVTEVLPRPFKAGEAALPDPVTSSLDVQHSPPEVTLDPTSSNGGVPSTGRTAPGALSGPDLAEIPGIVAPEFGPHRDKAVPQDSCRGPDSSGTETGSEARITRPPPPPAKNQSLPSNPPKKSIDPSFLATRHAYNATLPAVPRERPGNADHMNEIIFAPAFKIYSFAYNLMQNGHFEFQIVDVPGRKPHFTAWKSTFSFTWMSPIYRQCPGQIFVGTGSTVASAREMAAYYALCAIGAIAQSS